MLYTRVYKPRIRVLEQPEFGCWMANYIRMYSGHRTPADYARAIGETQTFVNLVIRGIEFPCQQMLEDMGYTRQLETKERYIAKSYVEEQETEPDSRPSES